MRKPSSWALALALATSSTGAVVFSSVTLYTGVVEKPTADRVVCAVSNTSAAAVTVDGVRIKNAAGAVMASLGSTTVGPMETLSVQHLTGNGQRRCEVDADELVAEVLVIRMYNRNINRSNDGTAS